MPPTPPDPSPLIGASAVMLALRRQVARVATTSTSVCIRGESGTEKELVARALHALSGRAAAPFVPVNCTTIPPQLQASELFGHERGAFAGATTAYAGLFEQADRGTLLLEEPGALDLASQIGVRQVLVEHAVRRLGGTDARRVDVRVVSATHCDLEEDVRAERLDAGLHDELVRITINVPPLRERREDLPALVTALMPRISRDTGLAAQRISAAALDALMRHDWPGNARELHNVVHRAMMSCARGEIDLADLPADLRTGARSPSVRMPRAISTRIPMLDLVAPPVGDVLDAPEEIADGDDVEATTTEIPLADGHTPLSLVEVESAAIRRALRMTSGNVSLAARLLKIGRATLYRRISELALDVGLLRPDR